MRHPQSFEDDLNIYPEVDDMTDLPEIEGLDDLGFGEEYQEEAGELPPLEIPDMDMTEDETSMPSGSEFETLIPEDIETTEIVFAESDMAQTLESLESIDVEQQLPGLEEYDHEGETPQPTTFMSQPTSFLSEGEIPPVEELQSDEEELEIMMDLEIEDEGEEEPEMEELSQLEYQESEHEEEREEQEQERFRLIP